MKKLNQVLPGFVKSLSTFLDWLIFISVVSLFFTYLPMTSGIRDSLLDGTSGFVQEMMAFWVDEWLLSFPLFALWAIVLRKLLNIDVKNINHRVTLDDDRSRNPHPTNRKKQVWVFGSDEKQIRWSRQMTDALAQVSGKLKSCLSWGFTGFLVLCIALPALSAFILQELPLLSGILTFWDEQILGIDTMSYSLAWLFEYNAFYSPMFSSFNAFYIGAWAIQLGDLLLQRFQLRSIHKRVKKTLSPTGYSQLCSDAGLSSAAAASARTTGATSHVPADNPAAFSGLPFPTEQTKSLKDNLAALERESRKADYERPFDVIWISSLDHSRQMLKYIPGNASEQLSLTTGQNEYMTLKFTHHPGDDGLYLITSDGNEHPLKAHRPLEMTMTGDSPDFYMTRFPHRPASRGFGAGFFRNRRL